VATIPTSEGGLSWTILDDEDEAGEGWMQAVAILPGNKRLSVSGHADDNLEGEWMGTVHHPDGAHGNYGYAPGTPHIRKALRYFAEKATGLSIVKEK